MRPRRVLRGVLCASLDLPIVLPQTMPRVRAEPNVRRTLVVRAPQQVNEVRHAIRAANSVFVLLVLSYFTGYQKGVLEFNKGNYETFYTALVPCFHLC